MEQELSRENFEEKLYQKEIDIDIGDLICKGGQKWVYKGVLKNSETQVVFKVMIPSENILERVKREVNASKLIKHPNVPKILYTNSYDVSENEYIWVIEEFIKGKSLRTILNSGKRFNISEVVKFIDTMLSILAVTEKLSIVHRDIKPDNIIVDEYDKFWLIDFGIARHLDLVSLTKTNALIGPHTIGYSAAEQLRNRKKDIDIRADIFSLGVVCAEMIIGQNPYLKDNLDVLQIIKKIEQQPLPPFKIIGDDHFFLAKFIKSLGDNRASRRPQNIDDARRIFDMVKKFLTL